MELDNPDKGSSFFEPWRVSYSFEIPVAVSRSLAELSPGLGLNAYTSMLAALAILLQRYSGHDNTSIEVGVFERYERSGADCEDRFLGKLLIDLTADPNSLELIKRVEARIADISSDQDPLLSRVSRPPESDREIQITTISVMFSNPFEMQRHLASSRFEVQRQDVAPRDEGSSLLLSFSRIEDRLRCAFEYPHALIDEPTISQLARHLTALLERVSENPRLPISKVEMLEETERHQLLAECQGEEREYRNICVHELFEEQVKTRPRAVALLYKDQRVTYEELNIRANQLAHYLQRRGVGPEVLVGISIERSIDAVVGLLGILKAGGAYVPLNPELPQDRLQEIARHSRLSLVVSTTEFASQMHDDHLETICLDNVDNQISEEDSTNPYSGATPENVAYVVYTSGTTGKPKGVLVIHRSLAKSQHYAVPDLPFQPNDVYGFRASLSSGASRALFAPLISGIPVVIIPDEQVKDPILLTRALELGPVTCINLMPVLRTLLKLGPGIASQLRRLRIVGVGGAALAPDVVATFRDLLPHVTLAQNYSSTEIAPSGIAINDQSISQGRPVANTRIYILDGDMRIVPIGVVGELYASGDHLARGYLARPDLTAEHFLPNPFGTKPGERLYRTGDLGRYLPAGDIELIGRADHQVKIRGFRVELEEVESVLSLHEDVEHVAVTAQGVANEKRLIAYVSAKPDRTLRIKHLRDYLGGRLPNFMMPAAFVIMERLPFNRNGKVDRASLPQPSRNRPELDSPYEPPRSPVEAVIAEIWSDLLSIEQVGVHDHFLELGGDSLLGAQVVSRISERLGLELRLLSLFQHPTIAELAEEMSGVRHSS